MATWRADVFVNSRVGRIQTEVESSTYSGAKEQILAKHGDVSQIANLHQVSSMGRSSSSSTNSGGTIALIGLIAAGWAFFTFTPWILMGIGGTFGTWMGEKLTGQSVEEYSHSGGSHKKAAILLAFALILGGIGFVKGDEIKKGFDSSTDTPSQIQKTN